MPYKCEKMKIPREFDRRVKVTPAIADNMRKMQLAGYSLHAIAREFGVDRKTVKRYVQPGYMAQEKEKSKRRKYWLEYYSKDQWREFMKNHRHYKRELELAGKLSE